MVQITSLSPTIQNLEDTDHHFFSSHIQLAKQWIAWKQLGNGEQPSPSDQSLDSRPNIRNIHLGSLLQSPMLKYSKTSMNCFAHYLWNRYLRHQLPDKPINKWTSLGCLTPRRSSRKMNSLVMDFLHGHSLRFGNFRKSVGDSESDKCLHCESGADSPEHQLFYCEHFDNPLRGDLLAVIDGESSDFSWRILTGPFNEIACTTLYHLVHWIVHKDIVQQLI